MENDSERNQIQDKTFRDELMNLIRIFDTSSHFRSYILLVGFAVCTALTVVLFYLSLDPFRGIFGVCLLYIGGACLGVTALVLLPAWIVSYYYERKKKKEEENIK